MAKPAKKPEPEKDEVEILEEVEQGTVEWKQLHIGVPSASNFATIMASGKDGGESIGRRGLLNRMAGEILTGEPAETYKNAAMQRGNDMEQEARDYYERTRFVDLKRVGFVRRSVTRIIGGPLIVGCSPDALIPPQRKALEVKTMAPAGIIEMLEKGAAGFPPEHRAQCQGTLWVTGYRELDLLIFYRGMPVNPIFSIGRDEAYIQRIAEAIEVFSYDLRKLVERIKNMGGQR